MIPDRGANLAIKPPVWHTGLQDDTVARTNPGEPATPTRAKPSGMDAPCPI